jgi:putative peptidoglycan lipid II flippase
VNPPVLALAWGVAIGGVLQLGLQLRPLARLGMLPKPSFAWRDPGVRRVLIAMGPAALGVSAAQVSALINTQLAAWLGDGRISWITYADRLMEFPSALLGVAIGTVILPSLAKHHADADQLQYSALLDWGIRVALLFALPAAIALWLLAVPLIATLYQYGRFTPHDVFQVRTALIGYAVGLAALILVKILAPGFFARQNLKTPVKIAFFTVLVTQAFALTLMWPLGHAGLTLATSLGACVNAGLLFTFLYRRRHYVPSPGWLGFASRLVVALGVLAAVLAFLAGPASYWIEAGLWTRVGRLGFVIAAAGVAYFGTLWLLGFRLADFSRREADRESAGPPDVPPEA